jgi:F-type H+-transporting ATPase subunit epsilon
MPKTLTLHISTPERQFYMGEVEMVVITSYDGEMGILPGHLSMVVALSAAPTRILEDGEWRLAAISGGFARIKGDGVVILADAAEWPEEIEVNRALEAKKRAEERLQARISEIEDVETRVALERALMRLTVRNKGVQ